MAVELPESYENISPDMIFFESEFRDKKYYNIRKTYEKEGEMFLGKGITVDAEGWESIKQFVRGK